MDIKHVLITFFKEKRSELGFTQEQFAEFLEMPLRSYKSYEYGNTFPRPEALNHISEKLGISVAEMFLSPGQSIKTSTNVTRIKPIEDEVNELKSKLTKLLDSQREEDDPDKIVYYLNETEKLTLSQVNIIRRMDMELLGVDDFGIARQMYSSDEITLWLSGFFRIRDEYGVFRTSIYWKRWHVSKTAGMPKASRPMFSEPLKWIRDQFPTNWEQLFLPENGHNQDPDKRFA